MPVHRTETTTRRLPDGTVVTTTVREGTRRRRGELNRYLLGRDKNYSTTTIRTRRPDGTTVTTTNDTYAGVKGLLGLIVITVVVLVGIFGGGGGGRIEKDSGQASSSPTNSTSKPTAVRTPPAPPAGYSHLLYSYSAPAGGFDPNAGQANLTLSGQPIEVCYYVGPDEFGGGSISLVNDTYTGIPSVNLPKAGGAGCYQLADAAVARAFARNQTQPGNEPLLLVVDSSDDPAISVKLWEA